MNKIKLLFGLTIFILTSAFVIYKAIDWKVKDDYTIRVYHQGDHFVSFSGLKATILFDEENVEKSKISASIVADSINCGRNNAMKIGSKKSEALDVNNFPIISFQSTSITKRDSAVLYFFRKTLFSTDDPIKFQYQAIGNLTMKGVTKEIKIPFTFENEVFRGCFAIHPKDFNITSEMFQEDLNILLTIPVTK